MKTHIDQTTAQDLLEGASAADLLMLAILSGPRGRSDIQRVLEKRALGSGQATSSTAEGGMRKSRRRAARTAA